MKRLLILLTGITLIATSCTKEESIEPVNPGSDPTGTVNFQPSKKDTYLKVKIMSQGSAAAPDRISTQVSTGQKSTVDGIDFVTWKEQESGQTVLFGYKDHNLYTKVKAASPTTGAVIDLNFIYLNDTASVGYKWTRSAGVGGGYTANMPGEIIEKNITKQVQGKNYTNVTHSRVGLSYIVPGFGELTLAIYDFYIANNIGILKVDTQIFDGFGNQTGLAVSELMEYSIK
ncbi:hypothetical protein [Pinibacter aurantiacus]|uniref:Uncharacterized protein n=1 Tax=Pinibacter aurantiacus TaxID=2851599 RepID=A0A9E2W2W5_9BACT|nr:hypothetical protein [Pinibacter aurantiacus]MBV4355548.1 hypothetical protein [Pinibacter aurantiacus]